MEARETACRPSSGATIRQYREADRQDGFVFNLCRSAARWPPKSRPPVSGLAKMPAKFSRESRRRGRARTLRGERDRLPPGVPARGGRSRQARRRCRYARQGEGCDARPDRTGLILKRSPVMLRSRAPAGLPISRKMSRRCRDAHRRGVRPAGCRLAKTVRRRWRQPVVDAPSGGTCSKGMEPGQEGAPSGPAVVQGDVKTCAPGDEKRS